MQAKDIDDQAFLTFVDRLSRDRMFTSDHRWVMRHEVEQAFPHAHWKVLLAKAKALGRRGLLDGCFCTCRGDYELTPAGRAFLAEQAEPVQRSV